MLPARVEIAAVFAPEREGVKDGLVDTGRVPVAAFDGFQHLVVQGLGPELCKIHRDHSRAKALAVLKLVSVPLEPFQLGGNRVLAWRAVDYGVRVEGVPQLGNVREPDDVDIRVDDLRRRGQQVGQKQPRVGHFSASVVRPESPERRPLVNL